MNYDEFINSKRFLTGDYGFEPVYMPDFLFDFQKKLVEWALRKGKAAIFADTGLGKTAMQLTIARNIVEKTNKNVLILTPLARKGVGIELKESYFKQAIRNLNNVEAASNQMAFL